MRTFIVGDHLTGTGPANVTKEYIRCFPKGTLYQKRTSKLGRVPELFLNILRCDVILFSGYSAQNVLGMKIAKALNKKTAYLVHGAITLENKINSAENETQTRVEEETLNRADLLLAVSSKFADWLKETYPQYKDKISYVTNGVDFDYLKSVNAGFDNTSVERRTDRILSIGGGMPRKMILNICKAVEIINKEVDNKLTLTVIGAEGKDTDAIKAYPFVEYLGLVDAKKKDELFRSSALFIQNSSFETFGLAVFESLMSGCSILTSKVAGALDLLPNAKDEDIVNDYNSETEIADKIKFLLDNPNHERLKSQINENEATWESRTKEMLNKLSELVNGKA